MKKKLLVLLGIIVLLGFARLAYLEFEMKECKDDRYELIEERDHYRILVSISDELESMTDIELLNRYLDVKYGDYEYIIKTVKNDDGSIKSYVASNSMQVWDIGNFDRAEVCEYLTKAELSTYY